MSLHDDTNNSAMQNVHEVPTGGAQKDDPAEKKPRRSSRGRVDVPIVMAAIEITHKIVLFH